MQESTRDQTQKTRGTIETI